MGEHYGMPLPADPVDPAELLAELADLAAGDSPWADGRMFGHAFLDDDGRRSVAESAYVEMLWQNGLDPLLFPSLVRLESEVVGDALDHLGCPDGVGSFTSGGTESVLLAALAARGRFEEAGGRGPAEIVLPRSAHPCFHKAAHYLGMRVVEVPVDPVSLRADPGAMSAAMTDATALVVASAPSYPHGVVDPVTEIAATAAERGVACHVDACIGGFVLPFFAELGAEVEPFDFRVEGVTSVSMDFHKYALAPKGASVVLYRDPDLRRHQFFAHSDWPGYTLVNPTVQSSRSGGPLAATWATLRAFGRSGYLEVCSRLLEGTRRVVDIVDDVAGLEVLGRPASTLVAVSSPELDVFRVADEVRRSGWHVYPQLSVDGLPASLHLTVLPRNCDRLDEFAAVLAEATERVRSSPATDELAHVRAAVAEMDLEALRYPDVLALVELAGLTGGDDGEAPMAEVNALLDELPPRARDLVVTAFADLLTR